MPTKLVGEELRRHRRPEEEAQRAPGAEVVGDEGDFQSEQRQAGEEPEPGQRGRRGVVVKERDRHGDSKRMQEGVR